MALFDLPQLLGHVPLSKSWWQHDFGIPSYSWNSRLFTSFLCIPPHASLCCQRCTSEADWRWVHSYHHLHHTWTCQTSNGTVRVASQVYYELQLYLSIWIINMLKFCLQKTNLYSNSLSGQMKLLPWNMYETMQWSLPLITSAYCGSGKTLHNTMCNRNWLTILTMSNLNNPS